jgi:uncharacterized protein (TIGR00299 family) protein
LKIAYFDCSAGISGDMCLGALVDAGVPLKEIEKGLKGLPVKGYRLETREVKRAGIAATKVDVVIRQSAISGQQSAKRWKDIKKTIKDSSLPERIKQRGLRTFKRLFEAEGRVHGNEYTRTHLHELGAVDCIVDIFGTLIGLDILGIERVYSSALNLGKGSVMTEHGTLPVPAPATAEILKGVPVYSSDVPFELTTPTGAALVRELAQNYGHIPMMKVEHTGYGAGQKDIPGLPNTLRIFLGEDILVKNTESDPRVSIIETNIDDMNPQCYEYVMERLFSSGALDVYLTQVIMKKGRPGVLLTVLCGEDRKEDIIDILFKETTTIGVRFYEVARRVLKREIRRVKTESGTMRVKVSKRLDGTPKFSPEYEDCKRIAEQHKIPLIEVMKRAKPF